MKYFLHVMLVLSMLIITPLLGIGCTGMESYTPQSSKMGTIEVHITDAPVQNDKEVKSVEITISSVSVHRAQSNQVQEQATSDNSTGKQNQEKQVEQQGGDQWLTLDIVKNKTFNLLELKNVEDILAIGQLEEGKYTQIRLIIESAKAVYDDNSTSDAIVPNGELKFVQQFDIVQNKVTTLLLDFDADRSFTVSGSGKVIVKPVVKLSIKPAK